MPSFKYQTNNLCDIKADDIINKIAKKLSEKDSNKAIGPDKVYDLVLKKCASSFSTPLAIIFKNSVTIGQISKIWKQANVTPLHKNELKLSPKNYHPISLTCIICKILESLIKDIMLKHLLTFDLISEAQHSNFLF